MKRIFFGKRFFGLVLLTMSALAHTVEIKKVSQKSKFAEPFNVVAELGDVAGKDPYALRVLLEPLNHQSLPKTQELIDKLQLTTEVVNDNKWLLNLKSTVPQFKKDHDFKLTLMLNDEMHQIDFESNVVADAVVYDINNPEPDRRAVLAVQLEKAQEEAANALQPVANIEAPAAVLPNEAAISPEEAVPTEEVYEVAVNIAQPIDELASYQAVTAVNQPFVVEDIVVSGQQYKVKKGDSLWKIANMNGYKTLQQRNVFMQMVYVLNKNVFVSTNPNQLYPGVSINLPAALEAQTNPKVFVAANKQFFTERGAPVFDQKFKNNSQR